MRYLSYLFLTIALLASCSQKPAVEGLWELHRMDVDMIPKGFNPTYIQFHRDGSFSVSKQNGDVMGLYKLSDDFLALSSNDDKWFNRNWKVITTDKELVLNDVKNSFRGAQMRFNKIDRFPSFEEFMEKLNGKWELYKIAERKEERRVADTYFTIEGDHYSILEAKEIVEEGAVTVDTRHHKITFENMDIIWNVRFVWDDLRLENEELGITYRLRRQ